LCKEICLIQVIRFLHQLGQILRFIQFVFDITVYLDFSPSILEEEMTDTEV
jgi:hypothetical protein